MTTRSADPTRWTSSSALSAFPSIYSSRYSVDCSIRRPLQVGPHESIGASSMPAEPSVPIGSDNTTSWQVADIHQEALRAGCMSPLEERWDCAGITQTLKVDV